MSESWAPFIAGFLFVGLLIIMVYLNEILEELKKGEKQK